MSGQGHYRGERFSLLTQHGKERVMGALFADVLDVRLERATGFDTDTLGTFTRDIARHGTQLEAARRKAEKGMQLLELEYGIASEGSFGPDPFGLFPLNCEVVIFIDRVRGIEIVGSAQGPAHHMHEQVSTRDALEAFARKSGFPEHGLVVRPDSEHDLRLRKELADWPALFAAFNEALAESRSSTVFVESEFRAHKNPTRLEMIRRAATNLVERIQSDCPRCGLPGYWRVERISGLPCRDCESPTNEARAERWGCVGAEHTEIRDLNMGCFADPSRCITCNP